MPKFELEALFEEADQRRDNARRKQVQSKLAQARERWYEKEQEEFMAKVYAAHWKDEAWRKKRDNEI